MAKRNVPQPIKSISALSYVALSPYCSLAGEMCPSLAAHWQFDSERLCPVVWLFETDSSQHLSLSFDFTATPAANSSASVASYPEDGLSGAMRRAQSAKVLLDATYPDTQPQDYDQVTSGAILSQ